MLTINTNTPWRYVPDLNRCQSNTNALYLTNYTNVPNGGRYRTRTDMSGLQNRQSTIDLIDQMEARVDHDSTPTVYEAVILPSYTISPFGACCVCRPRSSLATAKGLANPPLCQHWVSRQIIALRLASRTSVYTLICYRVNGAV